MYQGETNGRSALSVFVRVPVARGGVHCALQRFLRHAVTLLDGLARGGGAQRITLHLQQQCTTFGRSPRNSGSDRCNSQKDPRCRALDRGGVGAALLRGGWGARSCDRAAWTACGVIRAGACRATSAVRAWPLLSGCAGATTVASQWRGFCCRAQCL
ncbi:hypothetical protein TcYC6_0106030 [Trypanosoma cruzi]|nr:hypothetical protein TcYC6_0106030 [Trypanosoma cruzi]